MLVLGRNDVERLLDLDDLIDALGAAMADLSAGRASVPARTAAVVPERAATMLVDMPAYVPSRRALVSKLVSVFPDNTAGPLPVRQGVLVVFDPDTGEPAALMDAGAITELRTAACSALSVRMLARTDATVLAVLGTGAQARTHATAVARVRPFRQIRVAGRDPERAKVFAAGLTAQLGGIVRAAGSYQEALDGADVACAATYTVEPPVRREWLAPGTHVTSVGFNPAGREIDDATMGDATLYVEQRSAAFDAVPPNRDLAEPAERGLISRDAAVELGEVVSGTAPGRARPDQLTVYKSVGVAVQDAAAAALVLAAAGPDDGQRVEF